MQHSQHPLFKSDNEQGINNESLYQQHPPKVIFFTCPKPFESEVVKGIQQVIYGENYASRKSISNDEKSTNTYIVGGTPGAYAFHQGTSFVIANYQHYLYEYQPPAPDNNTNSNNRNSRDIPSNGSDEEQPLYVVITVMWPSCYSCYSVFDSGYFPTSHTGIVTKAQDYPYLLNEIDNQPAAEVYNK